LSDESNLYEGAAAGAFSFPNYGTVALGWTGRGLSDFYQEDAFKVGYGSVWPASWSRATGWKFLSNFSFGLTVNFLQVQLVDNDYTRLSSAIARKSNSGISLDAGVLYKNGAWKIAAVAKDILEPDLTLTTADKNVLPMELTAGLSYAWPSMGDFLSSMDVAFRENDRKARLGVEKWFWHKKIGCRAGLGYGRDWGADFYSEASLGLSFAFETIANTSGLDYAFLYPLNSGIQNTWGTHFISLSLKW
ncbi:MAG: conjugal transfer protein TraF, partial [Candidatus Firestonebacteria bacterium]|nr:conjugal transfer protein TraF [Candidatus Firestonebacteria bacterium]